MGAGLAIAGGGVIAVVPSDGLSAHTEASAVAVAALSDAVVSFQPAHGCGGSPTVAVRVQAPVPDARAEEVEGWTATATPDGAGNTVLEWTGGRLPTDEPGAFPVGLTVPDAVGTLLAFPAVQRCEDGAELAWIGTAPGDEYPAPQVLVLPAGSAPAATLEDVPADAPGRDLLVALAASAGDDDDAAAPATTPSTTAPPTPPTTAAPATTGPTTTTTDASPTTTGSLPATSTPSTPSTSSAPSTAATAPTTTEGDDRAGGSTGWLLGAVVAVVLLGGGAAVYARRRRTTTD